MTNNYLSEGLEIIRWFLIFLYEKKKIVQIEKQKLFKIKLCESLGEIGGGGIAEANI